MPRVALAALPWGDARGRAPAGGAGDTRDGGALAGAAAFLLANLAMRVVCPIDAPLHVLTWHLLPAGVAAVLSGALGTTWLGRWALSAGLSRSQRPG